MELEEKRVEKQFEVGFFIVWMQVLYKVYMSLLEKKIESGFYGIFRVF
jgi:hypothetical protein